VTLFRLKRREILILIGLWLLVAALLSGGVVWYLLSRPAGQPSFGQAGPAAGPTVSPVPTYTVQFVEVTARRLYPAAEALARVWAPDTQLVGANAEWSTTAINLIGKPTDWSFRFYSPSLNRLYLVGVTSDGQAAGAPHFRKEDRPPSTIQPEQWSVDSPEALAAWLDHGGGDLLGRSPGISVSMQLGVDPASGEPTWIVSAFGADSDQPVASKIDAATGQVAAWQP
jgi:hypothetical protein